MKRISILLVNGATSKANSGKTTSDKMIDGYEYLNENISKTIDLIKEVEISSMDQQESIIQINESILSLDKQTQTTASVASDTNDIAIQTNTIAKLIVNNVDDKEFIENNDINIEN